MSAKQAGEPSSPSEEAREIVQDTKAKMRAVLDAKKNQEHLSAERARNTGSVHGPEVPAGAGQKRFRRKSG